MCLKYPYILRSHTNPLQLFCVYVFNSLVVKEREQFMLSAPALYYALHSKKFSQKNYDIQGMKLKTKSHS